MFQHQMERLLGGDAAYLAIPNWAGVKFRFIPVEENGAKRLVPVSGVDIIDYIYF